MPSRSRISGRPNSVPSIAMIMPNTNMASAAAANSRLRARESKEGAEMLMKWAAAGTAGVGHMVSSGCQPGVISHPFVQWRAT